MPYPKPFARLSWLFEIGGTAEVAETGLHISTVGSSPFDADAFVAGSTTTDLSLLATAYGLLFSSTGTWWASYSDLVGMKLAALDVTGHYTSAPLVEAVTGMHGTIESVPPQSSQVLSLRSGLTFGRANYGRMYLPHTMSQLVNGTPYIGVTNADSLSAAAGVLLSSVNTYADGVTAGAGIVLISKVGAGTVKGCANVEVGQVEDTQRRRRNKLNEHPYSIMAL